MRQRGCGWLGIPGGRGLAWGGVGEVGLKPRVVQFRKLPWTVQKNYIVGKVKSPLKILLSSEAIIKNPSAKVKTCIG